MNNWSRKNGSIFLPSRFLPNPQPVLLMKRIFQAVFVLLLMASCSRKMYPGNNVGQTNSAGQGKLYPDGSIHYPDGSVKTANGQLWPPNTAYSGYTKTSASGKTTTIPAKQSTTPVAKANTVKSVPINTSPANSSNSGKGKPAEVNMVFKSNTQTSTGKSANTKNDTKESEPVVRYIRAGGPNNLPGQQTGTDETSARKDENGRHARKRGDSYASK